MEPTSYRSQLRAALTHLSLPAERQVEYLRQLGVSLADELALELHELMLLAPEMARVAELTTPETDAVERVDVALAAMSGSGQSQLWTPEALQTSREWREIRALADAALAALVDRPPPG